MNKPKRNYQRENWMRRFESYVLDLDANHTGKIDWNTATYFYNSQITPEASAIRYVAARKEDNA